MASVLEGCHENCGYMGKAQYLEQRRYSINATKIINTSIKTHATKPVVPTEGKRHWPEGLRLIKRIFFQQVRQ